MRDHAHLLDFALAWLAAQLSQARELLHAGHVLLSEAARAVLAFAGLEANDTVAALVGWGVVLAVVLALLWLLRGVEPRRPERRDLALAEITRSPRRLGLMAVALFVLVFGGWSAIAPLASAAVAPGVISPDGYRKTVQHLEGGIIRVIHVREGDRVEAGEPLITLDDTKARAGDAEIRERLLNELAKAARLEAERTETDDIDFPPLLRQDSSKELRQVMEGQRQLLKSRHATYKGRADILDARIRQLEEQNGGLMEVIAAQDRKLVLIDDEIDSSQKLLDEGLALKPRVLALRRERADISAQKAQNRARIAENEQAMGETRLQLLTLGEDRQEKINSDLADVRRMLAELRGQLPSREDVLARTVIRAPVSGKVMNVRVTTRTGVIKAGEPLLDIVPDDGKVVIDARVRPTDIERITPGMSARVVLTAYRQRTLPLIHGKLRSVSADALTDDRTGQRYFLAKVQVDPDDIAHLKEVELMPGMPAEVMLMDGERSVFGYLLGPIIDSLRRGLRER